MMIQPLQSQPESAHSKHWDWHDIDFSRVEVERVRNDELLFYILAASSFIEIAADLYTRNLIEHYRGDDKAVNWLSEIWEQEEVQHGYTLRAYVQHVWPHFNWERAFDNFFAEYSAACTSEALEPGKAREMVARCVVETGTSTFYTMLNSYTDEPVLKWITQRIKQDEVAHYRAFRRFFERFNQDEHHGRLRIIRTLLKRFSEVEDEDVYIAFKHVYTTCHPEVEFTDGLHEYFVKQANRRIIRPHYPYKMAVRMVLNLLNLNRAIKGIVEPLLIHTARLVFFR